MLFTPDRRSDVTHARAHAHTNKYLNETHFNPSVFRMVKLCVMCATVPLLRSEVLQHLQVLEDQVGHLRGGKKKKEEAGM